MRHLGCCLLPLLWSACTEQDAVPSPMMTACAVRITVSGYGAVAVADQDLVCDKSAPCTVPVSCGTVVALHPITGPQAYDYSWQAGCKEHSDCRLLAQSEIVDVQIRFLPRESDGTNFYRYNPGPQGSPVTAARLSALWGSGPNDVWAGGEAGALLHFDGNKWSSVPSGVGEAIDALWGSAPNNVWAVGTSGAILRYRQGGWEQWPQKTTQELVSVWGSSSSSVWAVGRSGTILHFDGQDWRLSPESGLVTSALRSVHGSGPDDVWAVGNEGTILHYDGRAFTVHPSTGVLTVESFGAVRVLGSTEVWITGAPGFFRYDGRVWSKVAVVAGLLGPASLFHTGARSLWGAVFRRQAVHYDGAAWTIVRPLDEGGMEDWNAVWGSSDQDVWFVGTSGLISRYAPE